MKMLSLALITTVAISAGHADGVHVLHGLFCKSEAQVDQVIALIQRDIPPPLAVMMLNREEVACVLADRIWYMIDHPVIIGAKQHRGAPLIEYEGMLVGVLVGQNPRPVQPSLRIFFVLPDRLNGVPEASRT